MSDWKRICTLFLFVILSQSFLLYFICLRWVSRMEGFVSPNGWRPFLDYSLSFLYSYRSNLLHC